MKKLISIVLAGVVTMTAVYGEELVKLPGPDKQGGKPLMQALNERKTGRNYSDKSVSREILSNLLWAAQGVNRVPGKRTAPTARGANEIDLYVVLPEATYLYLPEDHALKLIVKKDLRAETGTQDFVGKAPVNIVYVVDYSKQAGADKERKRKVALADTGFIGQNIYLYCASEGLITVFRGLIDCEKVGKLLNLNEHQEVYFGQTVGYPDDK